MGQLEIIPITMGSQPTYEELKPWLSVISMATALAFSAYL